MTARWSPPRLAASRSAWLRHAPVVFLSALYLLAIMTAAARRPLWFDEILSYDVAKLGGPGTIIDALLAKAENHPPLDYIARHFSMSLFGGSELAFRLPSIIAMLIAALCLYLIVLRRTSVLPALVAFTFPFVTMGLRYCYEGRPYAFLFASMCLAFLAWQLVTEKPSLPRLAFLTLCLVLGPFSHYYGVLNYVPIAAGEAWRSWERRRIAWPVVACFAVSLASLALLVPFAIHASEYAGHFWTKLSPSMLIYAYLELFKGLIPALVAALVIYAAFLVFPSAAPPAGPEPTAIPGREVVAAIVLLLLPFWTYLLAFFVTKAFTGKYVLNAIIGAALLSGYLVHQASRWRRGFVLLVVLSFGLWTVASLGFVARTVPGRIRADARDDGRLVTQTTLPLVVSSHRFLQDYFYLPATLQSRIYYIADSKLALEYLGQDTDERTLRRLKQFEPINVTDLCSFTKEYQKFLLIPDTSGDPIVRKFIADQADIALDPAGTPKDMVLSITLKGPSGC